MDYIGIGIIGCGSMGRSNLYKTIKLDPRLKTMALYDPDQRSIDATLAGLDNEPVVCESYQDLLAMDEVEWVIIASWNYAHCEQTVAAFEAGKHVFCQKPLALSIDECIQMKQAWEKSGKMFNIGFTLRYSPHYRKLKELVAGGAIGKIISMEFNETLAFNHGGYIMGDWRRLRKNAGTHLLEKCSHDIDLVNWIVDSRVKRVASFAGLDFFTPENKHYAEELGTDKAGKQAYSTWPGLVCEDPFGPDKDIIDNQVAIIEYENGVKSTFHTNCNAGMPERRMYICGTEGTIRADVLTGTIEVQRIGFDTEIVNESTEGKGGHGGGDQILSDELADSMLNHTAPSVGLMEGLESAVACFAIDEAMDTDTVVDAAPYWEKIKNA